MLAAIPFPHLDPVALRVGPFAIRWYGLAYALGFFVSYRILRRLSGAGRLRVSRDAVLDLVCWLALGVIAGGRFGWWMFYHRASGTPEPYEPFAIWHGGMSFHGGLIGTTVALLLWSWRNRAPFSNLADAIALVAPIGLLLGRVANFVNAELVGRPTGLPWAVVFPGDAIGRHPSQLYEALLEGSLLLVLLLVTSRRRRHQDGQTAAMFLACYGALRFLVEFTREPDPQLGFIAFRWMTMGQLLSIALALIGLVILLFLRHPLAGPSHANGSLARPARNPFPRSRKELSPHE